MNERIRTRVWGALLLIALYIAFTIDVSGVLMPLVKYGARNGDYSVFWMAGRIDRSLVYDSDAISQAQHLIIGSSGPRPFLNPPTLLPLLDLFGDLPLGFAFPLWSAFSLLLFTLASLLVLRPWAVGLALIAPTVIGAATGQVSLLVGASVITAIAILPKRPLLAGVLLAAAALIKPQAVVLAPLALVAAREWRALLSTIAGGIAAGALSMVVEGPRLWLAWIDALQQFIHLIQTEMLIAKGVSPTSVVRILEIHGPAAYLLMLCGAALGIVVVWTVFRNQQNPITRIGALIAGCLLCTPYAMPHEMAPLMPVAASMLLDREETPIGWFAGALLISFLAKPLAVVVTAILLLCRSGIIPRFIPTPSSVPLDRA